MPPAVDRHGRRNAEIALSPAELLANIRAVQRERGLPLSAELAQSPAAGTPGTPNLDVEMETGTGKTYVYIKTIMELNKRYGWSKFIVVVPSVAIREGVRALVRGHRRALPAGVRRQAPVVQLRLAAPARA